MGSGANLQNSRVVLLSNEFDSDGLIHRSFAFSAGFNFNLAAILKSLPFDADDCGRDYQDSQAGT